MPVFAVIDVGDSTTTSVAIDPPMETTAPAAKRSPVMRIAVPPPAGPWFGSIPVTVGAFGDGPVLLPQRVRTSAAATAAKKRAQKERCRRVIKSGFGQKRFDNDDVAPDAAGLCVPFVNTNLAETKLGKQRSTCRVLREHAGDEFPKAGRFGLPY